jgi:ABC-type dipeptide/oligopeptide/nickel transport system permease component
MDNLLLIVTHIVIYFIGIITGVYAASQIEKDIDKRIKK